MSSDDNELFSFRPFLIFGASNPKPSSSMSSPSRSPSRSPPPPPPSGAGECGIGAHDNRSGTRCESCRAQPLWPCARCTFSNPCGSGFCAVCEAARPVEVEAGDDPAGSAPLRRCARKRERAAWPDVVEVCADEGDGADGGDRAPATKKGAFETHLDKKTFKVMTYNVWFREDIELQRRMDALGDLIQHHKPDLICFQVQNLNYIIFPPSQWVSYVELQEVTPYIYLLLQKSEWWQEYKCLLSHEMAIRRPYYCMQMSKFSANSFHRIPFSNSIMGRELCIASVNTGWMNKLVLATSHLESPCPAPPRWDQMYSEERVFQADESLRILGAFRNAIFCGDMNWDDKGDGPFPLPDGWVDAWVEQKPGENGWTYDTKANGMLSGNRTMQKRLDRFVCKLADFKIDGIEMIGKEAILGVSYYKEKVGRKEVHKLKLPVLPSDHFGLVLTITHQDENF